MGAIGLFAFGFVPKGWLACAGQLLPMTQYNALFSLLGTTYGGDGKTNFALPDLRGRAIVGSSPAYLAGTRGGTENVVLATGQMASHYHNIAVSDQPGNTLAVAGSVIGASAASTHVPNFTPTIYASTGRPSSMGMGSIGTTGANFPHNNMQPFQVMNYCICVNGIFPSTT